MYLLDNSAPQAVDRFDALSDIFDEGTIALLERLGVAGGWRCLEAGAGGGSIARWLADRVGSTGHVVATDIDTRHVQAGARDNLRVRRHDLAADPVPDGPYDLIHTRLVLMHLPDPDASLRALVASLAPRGWILVEDFGAPARAAGQPLFATAAALRQVFTAGGVQVDAGQTLQQRFRDAGLSEVDGDTRSFVWRGGSAGAKLLRSNFEQLRDALLRTGLTAEQFAADLARLDDPAVAVPSPVMWAAWGRRV